MGIWRHIGDYKIFIMPTGKKGKSPFIYKKNP